MSTQSFGVDRYKAGQRQQWDSVAIGWKKWWPTIEQGVQSVSNRLVDLAEIRPGQRVLDIATGIGEPALTAAWRVGSTGRVVATDQSPQMLAIAHERASTLGLTNVEFREVDAEVVDFPDSSFDAVVCRWGLMFLPNLTSALAAIRRVLVPNGTFATAVWDVPPKVPIASLAFGIAQKMFQLPPPPLGTPSLFGLADGVLERAMTQAGFTDVRAEALTVTVEFPSSEAFTQYLKDVAAPIVALLANQPSERQDEFWQALATALQQYATAEGNLRIPSTTICVVGRR